MDAEKKRIETYMLSAARDAGVPIPLGEEPGEEPDFKFTQHIPPLGIETTEILRPASSNHGIVPVEAEVFHKDVLTLAERNYYSDPNARVVHVNAYFTNPRGAKSDKRKMVEALVEFVRMNNHKASPATTFMRGEMQTPDGFDAITIIAESGRGNWWSGEGGGYQLSDSRSQVEARIRAKNKFVPTYRSKLPTGAQVWLLLYTGVTVARSMMIPFGADKWNIPFHFDRVFWFVALERQFIEIQRQR